MAVIKSHDLHHGIMAFIKDMHFKNQTNYENASQHVIVQGITVHVTNIKELTEMHISQRCMTDMHMCIHYLLSHTKLSLPCPLLLRLPLVRDPPATAMCALQQNKRHNANTANQTTNAIQARTWVA